MPQRSAADEVYDLAEALFSGEFSPAQVARLDALVRGDAHARHAYLQYIEDSLLLRIWAGEEAETPLPELPEIPAPQPEQRAAVRRAHAAPDEALAPRPPATLWAGVSGLLGQPIVFALVTALVALPALVVVLLIFVAPRPAVVQRVETPLKAAAEVVARLGRTHSARWADHATPYAAGDVLQRGQELDLAEGLVEVVFTSGAEVILQGPAKLRLAASDGSRLSYGTLTASVSPAARGFWIDTPHSRLVDLGTRFGMKLAQDGACEVTVFEGAVQLVAHGRGEPQRLTTGQTAIAEPVAPGRTVWKTAKAASQPFPQEWPSDTPLITDVHSNNSNNYRVVPGGLQEDALAFTGRAHQWNGIDASGMPRYLLGADYVQTWGGEKKATRVTVHLTVTRPATLYLFYRVGQPTPPWLEQFFTNTGDKIGLDVGYPERERENVSQLGAGPGNSVDIEHTIWKLDVRPGRITLGPSVGRTWLSHFGLAAVERAAPARSESP